MYALLLCVYLNVQCTRYFLIACWYKQSNKKSDTRIPLICSKSDKQR